MIREILLGGAILAPLFALLWWRQTRTRNATSVDAAWAAAIGTLCLFYAARGAGNPYVALLGAVWSLRLALHILRRSHGRPEDGRYSAMRQHFGPKANAFFFLFYQGQALVALLFSIPILAAMQHAPTLPGVLVWLLAMAGESVADAQLQKFRADPAHRGKTCRVGLWRYSRHPNYFFEWVHWFAYVLIGGGALLTWIGPVLMLLFLYRLTGIPYTEAQALKSRGEDYREYQRTTSAFFPWIPKS